MNSSFERSWIWGYAFIVGVLTYWCTRGSDGEVVGTLVGFGAMGLIYWSFMWFGERVRLTTAMKHLAIIEFSVITAFVIDPQLDEMGTILYSFIPAFVAAIIASGWVVQLLHRRPVEESVPRCSKCNYILTGLTGARCPECGTAISNDLEDLKP